MQTVLLILCGLIWLPILFHFVGQRGFVVLMVWLFIAPVASNVIKSPGRNPFFEGEVNETTGSRQERRGRPKEENRYIIQGSSSLYRTGGTVTLRDLFEPTRILFGTFLVCFVVGGILKKGRGGTFDNTEILMGVFSVLLLVSVLFKAKGLAFGLRTTLDAFVIPFVGYFVARRLITNEDRLGKLTQVIGYMGVYLIMICLVELLTHHEILYRLGGPFKSGSVLYVVMSVVFFMTLLDSMRGNSLPEGKQALHSGIVKFILYLAPVIILLTWARGNWVGFLLGVGMFLLLGRRLVSARRKVAAIGLALIFLSVIGLGGGSVVPGQIIEGRIGNVQNIRSRIAGWQIGIQEGRNHPIFGIGLNNLRDVLRSTTVRYAGVRNISTIHNSFLSLFVELGVVGLLAYLAIVRSIIRGGVSLYRTGKHSQDRWRGVMVIAIVVGYLTPALFANTLYITNSLTHLYVYVLLGGISGLYGDVRRSPIFSHSLQTISRTE